MYRADPNPEDHVDPKNSRSVPASVIDSPFPPKLDRHYRGRPNTESSATSDAVISHGVLNMRFQAERLLDLEAFHCSRILRQPDSTQLSASPRSSINTSVFGLHAVVKRQHSA